MLSGKIVAATIGIMAASALLQNSLAAETNSTQLTNSPAAPVVSQAVVKADTVVVSATRIPQSIRDMGVSASVVPQERIEELHAQNAGEILGEVTDARVNSYGSMGAESEITLRGSTKQQVLVMVDGRPVNVGSVGTADLSMYPADQIERIEVIRGPASVLYGAGAMAGVVNIISKDPPEKLTTDVDASYGTKNTRILRLDNGARIGDLGYLIMASQNGSDGWRENSACEGYNIGGKLAYDLSSEARLSLNSGFSRQNKGVPGSTKWPSPNAKQYDEQSWFDLTHKQEFDTNSYFTGKAFLNQNWQNYKDPDNFTDQISRNQKAGLDLQQTAPVGERQLLLGGIYLENDHIDIRGTNDLSLIGGNRDLFTGAGFLQDEISLLESLLLTPGLRCDVQSKWGAELSPKVSGLYRIFEGTGLKASIGRGFRAPTADELYWRDDYSVGNPDLKPEESFSYDAGIQQEFGPKTALEVSAFQSHMKNLIAWYDNDGKGIYTAQNINDAILQGLETELQLQFTEEISGAVNYTLLDARDTSGKYDDETLPYRPKNKVGGRLGYQSKWGLKLSVNADYTDSVYSDRANTKELGGFMTLGAYAAQKVYKGVEIFARGDNILNKEYQMVDGYPMPGASIMGGLKATF